ncbi:hypothetical protein GGQ84_001900 [Desulfitispora alkaliphila]
MTSYISKSLPHAIFIGFFTFIIAIIIVLSSEFFFDRIASLYISFAVLLLIIIVGIVADVIGVAAAASIEAPLHAKAAKKVEGADTAVSLVRNADKVASFSSDFIGDICGTVSGAIGASIIFKLVAENPSFNVVMLSTGMTGLVAALTVSGKALGKTIAINKANDIIFNVGRVLYKIEKNTGLTLIKTVNERKRRR